MRPIYEKETELNQLKNTVKNILLTALNDSGGKTIHVTGYYPKGDGIESQSEIHHRNFENDVTLGIRITREEIKPYNVTYTSRPTRGYESVDQTPLDTEKQKKEINRLTDVLKELGIETTAEIRGNLITMDIKFSARNDPDHRENLAKLERFIDRVRTANDDTLTEKALAELRSSVVFHAKLYY